jgi:hypothetical protein
MGRLAVIAPWHGRHANTEPILRRVLLESTRPPDELWIVVEDDEDARAVMRACDVLGIDLPRLHVLPTPRLENGDFAVIPYSLGTNYALDRTDCDYIAYLTNDSMPEPRKYELMTRALAENPEWNVVYCGQRRNGNDYPPRGVLDSAFTVLDHTQVMHRRSDVRWRLAMADILLGDAYFWQDLGGPYYPVGDTLILDESDRLPDGITETRR